MESFYKYLETLDEKFKELSDLGFKSDVIENELYEKFKVYRGLRDSRGVGVVTGLTEISEINGFKTENGERIPIEGELYYRGISVYDIFAHLRKSDRFGFEEVAYLLLCGVLPNKKQLADFCELLSNLRILPNSFVRDIILKAPTQNIMISLSRCILMLYSYDSKADDITLKNVFRQSLQLIALMPIIAVYSYQASRHYFKMKTLSIRYPKKELSTAENILYMLRGSNKYTREEALLLDACLVLQMEHGGGNNSTFTTHVVTSTGTDSYSTMAASLGSLKGPKHGGANIMVAKMMQDIKENVKVVNEKNVSDYLKKILDKKAFDKKGLIYGMGHAIYSLSDPRANILHNLIKEFGVSPEDEKDYEIYSLIYKLSPELIQAHKNTVKGTCANVDFFSGYIYKTLDIPEELYTPLFAVARSVGWSAHRLEEIANNGKLIRPAYIAVAPRREFIPLDKRK